MKYFYLLNNKNTNCYLRYIEDINYKHYVRDYEDATRFTLPAAKELRSRFRHPENWRIIRKRESVFLRNYFKKRKKEKRSDKSVHS